MVSAAFNLEMRLVLTRIWGKAEPPPQWTHTRARTRMCINIHIHTHLYNITHTRIQNTHRHVHLYLQRLDLGDPCLQIQARGPSVFLLWVSFSYRHYVYR